MEKDCWQEELVRYLTKFEGEGEERNFFENKESVREELNKLGKELTGSENRAKDNHTWRQAKPMRWRDNLLEGELKEFKDELTSSVDN